VFRWSNKVTILGVVHHSDAIFVAGPGEQ
jgi:hypothetical protein